MACQISCSDFPTERDPVLDPLVDYPLTHRPTGPECPGYLRSLDSLHTWNLMCPEWNSAHTSTTSLPPSQRTKYNQKLVTMDTMHSQVLHCCANIIECTHTSLDRMAHCIPELCTYKHAHCSLLHLKS